MRIELIILLIAGFIIANIYTDGKYVKIMMPGKILPNGWLAIGALFLLYCET